MPASCYDAAALRKWSRAWRYQPDQNIGRLMSRGCKKTLDGFILCQHLKVDFTLIRSRKGVRDLSGRGTPLAQTFEKRHIRLEEHPFSWSAKCRTAESMLHFVCWATERLHPAGISCATDITSNLVCTKDQPPFHTLSRGGLRTAHAADNIGSSRTNCWPLTGRHMPTEPARMSHAGLAEGERSNKLQETRDNPPCSRCR